ncbi:MAG: hypothetical protein HQL81_00320 [Magnetococcales bacterium]|nr:hypothetical protein [Magnetococcales bacterium]
MNFKNYVVLISVPSKDGLAELATGYPVAPNLILTARHVLETKDRDNQKPIKAKWWYHKPKVVGDQGWLTLADDAIVWRGEGELDAALLRLPEKEWTPKEYLFLSSDRPSEDTRWASEGFPHVARRKELPKATSFQGNVYSKADAESYFELSEDANPDREAGWKGVSGMAVFVRRKILGIVRSIPTGFKSARLHAVPSWKMLEDPAFRKAIGYDDKQKRLNEYRGRLMGKIKKSFEVFDSVARRLNKNDTWSGAPPEKKVGILADCFLETSLHDMLSAFNDELLNAVENGEVHHADVLFDVVMLLLPALHDHGIVEGIRSDKKENKALFVQLPACLATVAEIVMAGVDGRETRFRPRDRERQFPKGVLQLPDAPDSGFGSQEKFIKDLDQYLVNKFYDEEPGEKEKDIQEKLPVVFAYLKDERDKGKRTSYLAFLMPGDSNKQKEIRGMMEYIAGKYPIACLALNDDIHLKEFEVGQYNSVRRMVPLKDK